MKHLYQYNICFMYLLLLGCKALDTQIVIEENKIPEVYKESSDTTNIADLSWKEYINDTILIGLIEQSLASNFDLQMALQRIEISRAMVKNAQGELLPSAAASVSAGMRRFGLYTMDGAGNITTEITPGQMIPINLPDLFLGIQSSWEVDIWSRLRNQKRSAISQFIASMEGVNFVVTSLISDVSVAYYELLALDNELEFIRQTLQKQHEALEVVKLQKEAGRANELAVQQFTGQLLNSQVLERETLQRIVEFENFINFLLGRYPQPIVRKPEYFFQENPEMVKTGIPSQLLRNRADIREAELLVTASKFDLKVAKASFYPGLNIQAGIGLQAFNPEYLLLVPTSVAYNAIGSLVAPVVNFNALKAQFNTAKANQITALYQYQETVLNAFVEVANELSNIENLYQMSILQKQQNEVFMKSVETSAELYSAGRAGYLEVLLAQQNAIQTQLELISFIKRQRIANINIYRALGGGWK